MPMTTRSAPAVWLTALVAMLGCEKTEPPAFSYYDDRIAGVIQVGCVQQTTGCHVANARQAAVGNLDLSSYDALLRREDVLYASGPYQVGQLLLKGGEPVQVPVQTFDAPVGGDAAQRFVAITTDIKHAGGTFLREGSDGYAAIKSWIQQGYRRDGSVVEEESVSVGGCRKGAGSHPGFDPDAAPADQASYEDFVRNVQPVLESRCAGGSCHGSPIADLYLTCGGTEVERRWNYFAAVAHLDRTTALSELLRRPLSKQRGGTFHEGGTVFLTTGDPDYAKIRSWAEALTKRAPELVEYQPEDENLRFFGNYVQPMLVKKGCMFSNCHGPAMFHDLRLRTGSQGTFSRIAIDRNYEMAKLQLAVAAADPDASRLIAKNLFPAERGGRGLAHRGGALFEDFDGPAEAADCDGVDVTAMPLDTVPAYCVLREWHRRERAAAGFDTAAAPALVWVSRPLDVGDVRDFDSYRPGADLLRGELTLDADGRPSLGLVPVSLLGGCGLAVATADVRGPAVSWDGTKLAFAARSSADAPLRLYEANSDGSSCAPIPDVAAAQERVNGILTHDFDPAYAPDGRLVFASSRGNLTGATYDYEGPTRTPSQLAPNANLYVLDRTKKQLRQLTFLLDQEVQPSFMADGRLIFTAEKRAPEFFQLAGRRQNLDGGDYHPLFAQRSSVGFEQATEIVELPNRNLALVAAPAGTGHGAGTIAIVNRSIGPDQSDRDPSDKLYLHSLSFPAPGAFDGQAGVFRSPAALPSRWIVVACDQDQSALGAGPHDFDVCALDPGTGELARIGGTANSADVELVAVYARDRNGVFTSRIDEANGRTRVRAGTNDAEVHLMDLPLLGTLLFANTRTGRPIDGRVGGFDLLEALPPPASMTSFSGPKVVEDDFGQVYVDLKQLGHVQTHDDGSVKYAVSGGHPLTMRLTDTARKPLTFEGDGPLTGEMIQREQFQFYPGEQLNQSFPRRLFNGMCGGCHGSITGYELDVAVDIDVLTTASQTAAAGDAAEKVQ
jgi:hypothetical protein